MAICTWTVLEYVHVYVLEYSSTHWCCAMPINRCTDTSDGKTRSKRKSVALQERTSWECMLACCKVHAFCTVPLQSCDHGLESMDRACVSTPCPFVDDCFTSLMFFVLQLPLDAFSSWGISKEADGPRIHSWNILTLAGLAFEIVSCFTTALPDNANAASKLERYLPE